MSSTNRAARFSALRDAVTRWGWLRALYAFLMARLHRHIGLAFCHVTARPLTIAERPATSGPERQCKILTEPELLGFSKDPELDMTEEFVRAACKRDDICVGALCDQVLTGYSWFAFDTAPHLDGLWVAFAAEARYAYKSFVRPTFRGARVMAEIILYSDAICREKGKTLGIGFIDSHNYASYRSAQRLGARTVGYAGYLNCLDRTFTFRSPGARRHGFHFYRPVTKP